MAVDRKWVAAWLLAAAAILFYYRGVYWRPFEDTAEESTVSFHAYGFAAASVAGLGSNPLVARHVDIHTSEVKVYPHWPNGFFLALEGALRLFGRTEAVGRTVAILATLGGFALAAASLGQRQGLVWAALPWILLSPDGRDSISFVFLDAALCLGMGALMWASGQPGRWVFRVLAGAALFFNQLVAPYAAVLVLLRWIEKRSRRELALDAAALAAASGAVLLAIGAGSSSLDAGFAELERIYRFNLRPPAEPWLGLLARWWRESLNLGAAGGVLVAAAWLLTLGARQWRIVILLPSFLLFAVLVPQYSTVHHFARLPFVFFSLVTLAGGLELAIGRLARPGLPRHLPLAARMLAGLAVAARLAAAPPQYHTDPHIRSLRESLTRVTRSPALAGCNAFSFRLPAGHHFPHEYHPQAKIGQFFFGRRVVERVQRGAPVRSCVIDLVEEAARPGP